MWPDTIVLPEPGIDDSLRLIERSKPLGIQDFTAQRSIEAFIVSILPRATRIDAQRLDADLGQPVLQVTCDELGTIVRPDMIRLPLLEQKRIERLQGCCQSNANQSPASLRIGALIQPKAGAILRGRRFSSI